MGDRGYSRPDDPFLAAPMGETVGMPSARLLDAERLAALAARASALVSSTAAVGVTRRRAVLGIAGAPGAGKTTLAEELVELLRREPPTGLGADAVAHLPMDGFHVADVQLRRRGLLERKGAPETFDADGYLTTIERVLADDGSTIYAPGFERDLEQPVAAAMAVEPEVQLVVTEGNYLLVDEPPWTAIRARMAEVWFVDLDEAERLRRLVARHREFGKPAGAAQAWALGPDQANAELVLASRGRADLVVTA